MQQNTTQETAMPRYSCITDKNPREIVLLRGSGCKWRKCTFCDYHLDFSKDEHANYELNKQVLSQVTGKYHHLEVINSGSFCDLDPNTLKFIRFTCIQHQIHKIHFECHWIHRNEIAALRDFFAPDITVKIKLGVETFDTAFRETILKKGITTDDPNEIAHYADEVCLLFGIAGQTLDSMKKDIEIGLAYFERICINLMVENTTAIRPCQEVIHLFHKNLYPLYCSNPRIDILLNNTDFGVGN